MSSATATRHVGCELTFQVTGESLLALHVAVADSGEVLEERFRLEGNAAGADPVPIAAEHGGRIQLVHARPGLLQVSYSASVGRADLAAAAATATAAEPEGPGAPPFDLELLVALRQSRYCPSDQVAGFAATTVGDEPDPGRRARLIAAWVFEHVAYGVGTSRSTDTAIDTLLGGEGVCRDFAHLTITLCRAVGVPARLAAVYAPGLAPMDFHAVAEIWDGGGWEVLDATRLAPRSSLVRIATGRDAADTAFASVIRGDIRLLSADVFAVIDGDLPADDHVARSTLA
jgi:transglutaminase-like putative cysteine protease